MLDYYALKDYAERGAKVGNWKGNSVFVCAKADLKFKGSGAFYIVYDDGNKLVGRTDNDWFEYGSVYKDGSVVECRLPKSYMSTPKTSKSSGEVKKKKQEVERDKPIGDVKVGLDVEDVLKRARGMTVEDLLKGFNYGL